MKDGVLLEEGEACPFELTEDGLLLPEQTVFSWEPDARMRQQNRRMAYSM